MGDGDVDNAIGGGCFRIWGAHGVRKSFQKNNSVNLWMRSGRVAAQSPKADSDCRRRGNFKRVAGQEGKNDERKRLLSRGMSQGNKPQGAPGKNRQVASRGAEQGCRIAAPTSAPEE
jgi:hypothetical protein